MAIILPPASRLFLLASLLLAATTSANDHNNNNHHSNNNHNDGECHIDCLHDTECVKGKANFTWHPVRSDTGEEFDFHKELSRDGYHCGCPPGLTGLRCGRKYESCNDGEHVCYNGGQCIATMKDMYQNDQQYCDCAATVDADGNTKRFSGKYCEVEIKTSGSRCGDANQNPCQNGGTCKTGTVDELDPCDCPKGYVGRMCEFYEPSVPTCSLKCQHGGTCRYGTKEEDHNLVLNEPNGTKTPSKVHVVHENYMFCDCPVGFSGVHCETEEQLCGDIKCRHGSTCVKVANKDTNEDTHHCDCAEINRKKLSAGEDVQFAGRHCEIKSTTVCHYDDDPSTSTFCAHDGICPKEWHEHCACPDGFFGAHCQFKQLQAIDGATSQQLQGTASKPQGSTSNTQSSTPLAHKPVESESSHSHSMHDVAAEAGDGTDCRLDCKNGGHCRHGSKTDPLVQDLVNKYGAALGASSVANLTMSYNKDFEHCACPSGFVGIECEYSMTQCGENGEDHPCFHGSTCTMVDGVPTCVCSEASTQVAGVFCQHLADDVCSNAKLSEEPGSNRGFCVNGGVCVTNKDGEAACRCHSKYEGPHCEYSKDILGMDAASFNTNSDDNTGAKQSHSGLSSGAKLSLFMTVMLCIGIAVTGYFWYQRKHLNMKEDVAPVYPDMERNLAISDESLRAAPVVDVGPEKDFDGNELKNVELL